jgi:hypothetical protein
VSDVFVLIHAPLVGPSTWRWVAEELTDARVVVPDLHAGAEEPAFDTYVRRIAEAIPTGADVILVGHSGAGVLLPFAAEEANAEHVTYVFADAGLPPLHGNTLEEHPVMKAAGIGWNGRPSFAHLVEPDGHLPPWHTWWGDDGMTRLVPDADRRAFVCRDVPRLPLTFWDQGADVPVDWASSPASYLLFSDNYRLWADAARSYGWPVEEVAGTHLELVNRPGDVAAAITRVARA